MTTQSPESLTEVRYEHSGNLVPLLRQLGVALVEEHQYQDGSGLDEWGRSDQQRRLTRFDGTHRDRGRGIVQEQRHQGGHGPGSRT